MGEPEEKMILLNGEVTLQRSNMFLTPVPEDCATNSVFWDYLLFFQRSHLFPLMFITHLCYRLE